MRHLLVGPTFNLHWDRGGGIFQTNIPISVGRNPVVSRLWWSYSVVSACIVESLLEIAISIIVKR